jgi:hypothetical protein
MTLCQHPIGPHEVCQRPRGHTAQHSVLPGWTDLLQGGITADDQVRDKVKRSPTETAGKGGEWGFLQNKVNRASQVAIPLDVYIQHPVVGQRDYDGGFLVYASPAEHAAGLPQSLVLGINCVVLYTTQAEFAAHPPPAAWNVFKLVDASGNVADSWRTAAGWTGHYYARIPKAGGGWDYKGSLAKAIGIRQDEYCSQLDQRYVVGQMAYIAWSIQGTAQRLGQAGPPQYLIDYLTANGMLDRARLEAAGILTAGGAAQCPFCRAELTYNELVNQAPQQVGRRLSSSNATALHLMHIEPLKMGEFNHKPYNLAFGHAKCNHAQGEDSILRSVEFLFERRLSDALHVAGLDPAIRVMIRTEVMK